MTRSLRLSDLPADVRARIATTPRKSNRVLAELRRLTDATRHDEFYAMLRRARLPIPITEHRFDEKRLWRFDYAFVAEKVAIEVEGGAWTQGRHTRGRGFIEDMHKYSEAAVQGWIVIRVVPGALNGKQTETWIRRALRSRSSP